MSCSAPSKTTQKAINQKVDNVQNDIFASPPGPSETIQARLPKEVVKFVDLGVAKGVWTTRGEAVRDLCLAGVDTQVIQDLGINEDASMAHGLALLSRLALQKSVEGSIRQTLAMLEGALGTALKGGPTGSDDAKLTMQKVRSAISLLSPFWRTVVVEFMQQSPTFRLGMERYGGIKSWTGGS